MTGPVYSLTVGSAAIPVEDVLRAGIDRKTASLFDRLSIGRGSFILDNADGQYAPSANSNFQPNQPVLFTAVSFPSANLQVSDESSGAWHGAAQIPQCWTDGLLGVGAMRGREDEPNYWAALPASMFDGLGDLTLEALIKPTRQTDPASPLLSPTILHARQGDAGTPQVFRTRIVLRTVGADAVQVVTNSDTEVFWDTTNDALPNLADGTTRRLAITRTQATGDLELFLQPEGASAATSHGVKTGDTGVIAMASGSNLVIGKTHPGSALTARWMGAYDDLRIWSEVRSQSQIESNAFQALTTPLSETTLRAYYKFDETETYPMFTGVVDRVRLRPELGRRQATLDATDRARYLKQTISTGLQIDTTPSSLFTLIFSAAGGQPASIQAMNDRINFAFVDNISAGAAIDQVLRSGAHYVNVSGAGVFQAVDRNFDVLHTSINSYVNEGFGLTYDLNGKEVFNDVRISAERRRLDTDVGTVAWLENVPFTFNSGQTEGIFLEFVDPDTLEVPTPVNSVITPVQSFDYLANTTQSADGIDVTSALTVTFQTFAHTAVATITNNSGATAYLNHFQIRGNPLKRVPAFLQITEDSSSQALYSRQTFELDNELLTDELRAKDYSDFLVSRQRSPIPDIGFTLKNRFPDAMQTDLLDFVALVESSTGVSSTWLVTGVKHDINLDRGLEHRMTMALRLAYTKDYLILDKDPEGKLDIRELGF